MNTPPNAPFDDPQTFQIIGAAFEVHGTYGNVFSEPVYGEAFTIELQLRAIPFEREVRLPLYYKGELLPVCYRVDFVCFGEVLVEIKALPSIGQLEHGQVLRYLRAAKKQRALLLNFGAPSLQHRRVVNDLENDPVAR
jgi:GxxExxY protein